MFNYVLKRLGAAALTTFVIASGTFFAMHAVPGDPISGNKAMLPEIRKNIEARYGLDKPIMTQYAVYLNSMAHGDFGLSFTQQNREVNDIIKKHFPVSAILGVLALIFATTGGILFGSISALSRGKYSDRVTMFFVILGISVPSFVIGEIVQWLLTEINKRAGYDVLPVGGWGTFAHMIVPSVVLGLSTMAFLVRLMRSSLLEIIPQDYIRTAKAKGVPPIKIFFAHQLRNAILPVITYLGPAIAIITTGSFVVETIFAVPGLGRYFVQAVQQLDYTVIMGLTTFYGAFLVLMVMFVDITYGFIDPRISLAKRRA